MGRGVDCASHRDKHGDEEQMLRVVILAVIFPGFVMASEWVPLLGAEIAATLQDRSVVYDAARQVFHASGRTSYDTGQVSWGHWDVRGDQYCSNWPPAAGWACYHMDMDTKAGAVRFVGESGFATVGVLEVRE